MKRHITMMYARWSGPVSILLIILASLASCTNYEAATRHLNYGIAYMEAGQYTPALRELIEAEKNNPRDPRIQYFLGLSYYGKGLTREAEEAMKKAISLKPDYPEAHNQLGMIYAESGRLDEAVSEFRQALANLLYETPSFAMNNLGWAYYKQGKYNEAIAQYEEILKRDPASTILPLVEKNMGVAYYAQGNYGVSLVHLRKSLQLAPDFAPEQAHYWIGKNLLAQGKAGEAEAEFMKSVKASPNSRFASDSAGEIERLKFGPGAAPARPGALRPAAEPVRALMPESPPPAPEKARVEQPAPPPVARVEAPPPAAPVAAQKALPEKPKAAPEKPVKAVEKTSVHIVKQGETLYAVARLYSVSVRALSAANNIPPDHKVKIGQRLIIPDSSKSGPPPKGKP